MRGIRYAAQYTYSLRFHLFTANEPWPSTLLEVLHRSLTFAVPILPHVFLASTLVSGEVLDFLAIHVLRNVVRLPFCGKNKLAPRNCNEVGPEALTLERKPESLMRVVLVICLILVVFDLDEVTVDRRWVQTQTDKCVDGGCFGYELEGPALLVLELYQILVVLDNLVAFALGSFEQLGQGEPLASHLVAGARTC